VLTGQEFVARELEKIANIIRNMVVPTEGRWDEIKLIEVYFE
jgi:hypothetical protein